MRFLAYTFFHLKRMMKSKSVIFGMLLIPTFVVCLIGALDIGSGASIKISFDVVNQDTGELGESLIAELKKSPNLNVVLKTSLEAEKRIKDNVTGVALVIPKDFSKALQEGSSPEIKIWKLQEGNQDLTIQTKVNSFITNNLILSRVSSSFEKEKIIPEASEASIMEELNYEVINTSVTNILKDDSQSLSNSLTKNFILSFIIFSMNFIVIEIIALKKNKTLKRCLTTPNKNSIILSSVLLPFLLIGWLQIFVLVGISKFLFKVNWGSSYLALLLVFTALLLVTFSLGLLISSFVNNESSASTVVNMVATITCMISGIFMPLEYMPELLKKIAYFTPQNWALTAVQKISLEGGGLLSILPNVGILLLFAIAFFTAAASSLRDSIQ